MRTPTVEVRWISDRPRVLVQVVLRVDEDPEDDAKMYVGTGGTLAEAFDALAKDLRRTAEYYVDDILREKLEE